jgi:hypothetical protein
MSALNDNQVMADGGVPSLQADPSGYDAFYGGGVVPPGATLWDELSRAWLNVTRERLERTVIAARLTGV